MASARTATRELPLGAGALAGVNFETDRRFVAGELGFTEVAPNSLDAVSNRDFVLDYLGAAATCATHLSQLGAEIVLWSSEEFGFCEVADSFASGSSLMPQKKNPDAAELLRAKAPRVLSRLVSLHGVLHGLPLTYNKDLQEDKEALFEAIDTLELCLQVAAAMLDSTSFRRERMASAAADELIAATDIADLLVRRGVPFREAHGIVGGLVRAALERGGWLSGLHRGGPPRARPPARLRLLRPAGATGLAGVEGLRGRHGPRPRRGAAGAGTAPALRGTAMSLGRAFYERSVHEVARGLIGCTVRHGATAGRVVETESYHMDEPACHAHVGLTGRTHTLFGEPGRAYVYFSYGVHALLNAVAEPEGTAAAVLIRALEPVSGLDLMRARRGLDRAGGPLLGSRKAHPGAGHRPGPQRLLAGRGTDRDPAGDARGPNRDGRAHRHHQGGRASLALLRRRQPPRVAALAAGDASPAA